MSIYSGGTNRPVEFCYDFYILSDLIQKLTFLLVSLTVDSHSPTLLDLFIFSEASICSAMPFLPLGNPDHVVVSVS